MKTPGNPKKSAIKKSTEKGKEAGELRKPAKLKPLKEKEKKSWKINLEEDDDVDFAVEESLGLDTEFEDSDDEFFDDEEF